MSHYFNSPAGTDATHEVRATIWDRDYVFTSSGGVFSSYRLDPGTSVLFRLTEPPADRHARFLDLGCGFGPVAAALARECPRAWVDAVDTNSRALELTRTNAERLGVGDRVRAFLPEAAGEDRYDEIWSNPPIRIGKAALHDLLAYWLNRLTPDGKATMVVGKNLGADSLSEWLRAQGWSVTRLGSAKGFRVLCVTSK